MLVSGIWGAFSSGLSCAAGGAPAGELQMQHGIEGFNMLSKNTQDVLQGAGWLERPDWGMIIKSALWVLGPIGLSMYINRILKKDKQARLLKFKKQQPQQQGDPMAQLMMMMQMQHGGAGGMLPEDSLDGALIDQAQESNTGTDIESTWNEKDILPIAKRRVLQVIVIALRVTALFGIVNCVNVLKDCWKGNRVPASVRKHMNAHVALQKKQVKLTKDYQALGGNVVRKEIFTAQIAQQNGWKQHKVTNELKSLFERAETKVSSAAQKAATARQQSSLCQFGNAVGLPLLGWFVRARAAKTR
jgi:hypothetical protein